MENPVCRLNSSKSLALSLSLVEPYIILDEPQIEYFNKRSDFKCSYINPSLNFYITVLNTCLISIERDYSEYTNIHRLNPKITKLRTVIKSLKLDGFYDVLINNTHEIYTPEILSSISKILLKSIKEVLISKDLFSKIKKAYNKTMNSNNIYSFHKTLYTLPNFTKIVLTRIFKHFEIISNNSGKNNMDILSLCSVFLPSIIYDLPTNKIYEKDYFKHQIDILYFMAKYAYLLNTPLLSNSDSGNGYTKINVQIKEYFSSLWKRFVSSGTYNLSNSKKKARRKSSRSNMGSNNN